LVSRRFLFDEMEYRLRIWWLELRFYWQSFFPYINVGIFIAPSKFQFNVEFFISKLSQILVAFAFYRAFYFQRIYIICLDTRLPYTSSASGSRGCNFGFKIGWLTKFRFAKCRKIHGHFREISCRKVEVSWLFPVAEFRNHPISKLNISGWRSRNPFR
jgi:hypothetical protein